MVSRPIVASALLCDLPRGIGIGSSPRLRLSSEIAAALCVRSAMLMLIERGAGSGLALRKSVDSLLVARRCRAAIAMLAQVGSELESDRRAVPLSYWQTVRQAAVYAADRRIVEYCDNRAIHA